MEEISLKHGLSEEEAKRRLKKFGPNSIKPRVNLGTLELFISQFKSPIIIILLLAAGLSFYLGGRSDVVIILVIVLFSGILSFWQEKGATRAVTKLLGLVQVEATVVRNGVAREIAVEQVVVGDIIHLHAGDTIPADARVVSVSNLFVNEAPLTGETFPVEKTTGGKLFMGTHVVSGMAEAEVTTTGEQSEFGKISSRLTVASPETEFERGVKRFGYFLMVITLILVLAIFGINVYLSRPVLDSFLFALALAVGLTPQLLPAIISVNLSHGARRMAQKKVIVKRLASIENFGSMNLLCSDKTGTLTEGVAQVKSAVDSAGHESEKVLLYAYLNAFFETGFTNPIDEAIRKHRSFDVSAYKKISEIPYDFVRKRLSVVLEKDKEQMVVTKGAVANVLSCCRWAESDSKRKIKITGIKKKLEEEYERLSRQGWRTLAVAYGKEEKEMTFLGFIVLYDPVKSGVVETIEHLQKLGVGLKIITGDNRWVAETLATQVGLLDLKVLTGEEITKMSDEAFLKKVAETTIFAEVEPNQKERIINGLRQVGNVVGYIGDGINDATALHNADVSISVNSAVDVAKGAADIVLLKKDLGVLRDGILEGRRTFANTMKYIFMATSANFGNMFSMAGASLFLPFLPLLPKQILLLNLLTDFPEMTIATDNVDLEFINKPRRWDLNFIRNFMLVFGPLSSIFDFLTFGALLWVVRANEAQFRTGWFVESIISAAMVVLIIRTRRVFAASLPGKWLLLMTVAVAAVTVLLPWTPLGTIFGLTTLPIRPYLMIGGIILLYMLSAEVVKHAFYRRFS